MNWGLNLGSVCMQWAWEAGCGGISCGLPSAASPAKFRGKSWLVALDSSGLPQVIQALTTLACSLILPGISAGNLPQSTPCGVRVAVGQGVFMDAWIVIVEFWIVFWWLTCTEAMKRIAVSGNPGLPWSLRAGETSWGMPSTREETH